MDRSIGTQMGAFRAHLSRGFVTRLAVLRDSRGSIAEAIAAVGLAIVVLGVIAAGAVSDIKVVAVSATNAVRVQQLNSMVGKPAAITGWDVAADTALTKSVTLPTGDVMATYLWSNADPSGDGTTYYASMARSGNVSNTTICNDVAVVHPTLCVYASQYLVSDPRNTLPKSVPNLTLGSMTAVTPVGGIIASAPSSSAALWRFYMTASSVGASGTIRIMQDGKLLSEIPVTTNASPYFGSIIVESGGPVTIFSDDRAVNVTKLLLYGTRS
jgi:hypothetical protein